VAGSFLRSSFRSVNLYEKDVFSHIRLLIFLISFIEKNFFMMYKDCPLRLCRLLEERKSSLGENLPVFWRR